MPDAIRDLSPVHEAMLQWVLQNPEKGLKEMSAYFGYTMPWLSRVMNSDIFRDALASRQEAIYCRIADDIPAKLRGLADVAIEKLGDKLQNSEDPRFIRESFDSVMEHMGFKARGVSAVGTVNQQNNVFVLPRDDLARLRNGITEQAYVASGEALSLPAPSRVQAGDLPLGHPLVSLPPALHSENGEANGSANAGNTL